jgi:hypothetical protein
LLTGEIDMEKLLDLDKLHKQQARQKIRNIIIGGSAFIGLCIIIVLMFGGHRSPPHIALIEGSPVASITPKSPTTSIPTSTNSSSTYAQTVATDQTLEKQNETAAKQDIQDAQNSQSVINSETPPPNATITPVSIPTITPLASTCSAPSNLGTLQSQYSQAVGALNSFEQEIANPGQGGGAFGASSGSSLEAYEKSQLAILTTTANNAYNAYEAAEAQVHC